MKASVLCLLAIIFLLLSGCSLIESDAGKAEYTYRRTAPDGTVTEIVLKNAKSIGRVSATADIPGTGSITLTEDGVDAVGPMATLQQAQAAQSELLRSLIPLMPASPRQ